MSQKAPHFSLVTFPFLLWPPGDSALHNSVVTLLAFPPAILRLGLALLLPLPSAYFPWVCVRLWQTS